MNELQNKGHWTLPENWVWTTSSDVCASVRDGTHDTPKYIEEGFPLVTSKNLRLEGLDLNNVRYISRDDHIEISRRSGVDRGDILFAMIGTIGNPVIVKTDVDFSIKNVGLFKKNPKVILSAYLKHWLSSWLLTRIIQEQELLKGTTQKFIPLGNLRILPVPLAPLAEQGRIGDEIDKQFTRLDAAVTNLKRVQANLKRYKASVLKAACEGRLVTQDPADEPTEVLLERILAERRRKWMEQEWTRLTEKAQKKVAQARRKQASRPARLSDLELEEWQALPEEEYAKYLPKNDKWKEKYKEPKPVDSAGLPELPAGWVWVPLELLAAPEQYAITSGPFGSVLGTKDYLSYGVPVIRGKNIKPDGFVLDELMYVGEDKARTLKRSMVQPNDLVVVAVGSSGQPALVPESLPRAIISQNVNKITLSGEYILPEYALIAMQIESIQNQLMERTTDTVRKFLSLTNLRKTLVPVPSIKQQQHIIDEVDRSLSIIQTTERSIRANLARAERLRQVILRKAFRGQLITQDPNDEPASALLERIQRGET